MGRDDPGYPANGANHIGWMFKSRLWMLDVLSHAGYAVVSRFPVGRLNSSRLLTGFRMDV